MIQSLYRRARLLLSIVLTWTIFAQIPVPESRSPRRPVTTGTAKPVETSPAPVMPVAPPAHTGHLLQGTVSSADQPLPGATVRVTGLDDNHPDRLVAGTGGPKSEYSFGELLPGKYKVEVERPGYVPVAIDSFAMPADHDVRMAFVLARSAERNLWEVGICGLFLLFYLFAIMAARWYSIARPNQELLREKIDSLEVRMSTETLAEPVAESRSALRELRKRAETLRRLYVYDKYLLPKQERKCQPARTGIREWIFWSGSKENAGWSAVHEIERELAAFLAPEARVLVRLGTTEQLLRLINKPPALALAEVIHTTLDPHSLPAADDEQARELLAAAIQTVNDERDANFFSLSEWYSKAMWMTLAASLLIFTLTLADDHAILFLVGGAGGLLSRLERTIRRTDVPLDYGASWTTLFLSPVLGGLGSWFGIALIAFLAHAKILGDLFAVVSWDQPYHQFTLAAGAALGFSERLFDSLVNAVDQRAAGDIAGQKVAAGAGTTVSAEAVSKGGAGAAAGAETGGTATASSEPEVQIAGISPEQPNVESLVSLHGKGFDKEHIADVKMLDSAGAEIPLTHVQALGDTLEFVAPEKPGQYKLRLVLKAGTVLEHNLEVHPHEG